MRGGDKRFLGRAALYCTKKNIGNAGLYLEWVQCLPVPLLVLYHKVHSLRSRSGQPSNRKYMQLWTVWWFGLRSVQLGVSSQAESGIHATCRRNLNNWTVRRYVVGLSPLGMTRSRNFCFFSVSERGKGLCLRCVFCTRSREGNFGLHSTPFNYSSFTVVSR